MTITVPKVGYTKDTPYPADSYIKWIMIGAAVIAVIIGVALIMRKK